MSIKDCDSGFAASEKRSSTLHMNAPYCPPEVVAWPGWPEDEPYLEEDINPPAVERELDRARLRRTERQWKKIQPWLRSQGYLLRPRFRPGWVPSWQVETAEKGFDVETREDSIPHENVYAATTIDALRISDGLQVCLKRIPCRAEDSTELSITQFLSQPKQRKDARNHAIPLLDVIRAPDHCFLVLPFYRTLVSRKGRLDTVGEGFDLVFQTLEGLAYLHELRIAHRDLSAANILMDAARMFPHGFHLDNAQFDMRGRRISKVRTRTQIGGVRYCLIDFGEAMKFEPSDSVLIDVRSKACIHAPETLGEIRPPYDPFKADIYTMGNTYRKILVDGYKGHFDMLVPLINVMTAKDPNARPTITEAMEQFCKIRSSYSRTALHVRVEGSSSERASALGRVFISGWHWTRQLVFAVQGLKW
ncbi:kinase-like protein [Dentipellis sp. KUC8613]|nr:kinase-like protein [Dentipellis sp. KUC8613]